MSYRNRDNNIQVRNATESELCIPFSNLQSRFFIGTKAVVGIAVFWSPFPSQPLLVNHKPLPAVRSRFAMYDDVDTAKECRRYGTAATGLFLATTKQVNKHKLPVSSDHLSPAASHPSARPQGDLLPHAKCIIMPGHAGPSTSPTDPLLSTAVISHQPCHCCKIIIIGACYRWR